MFFNVECTLPKTKKQKNIKNFMDVIKVGDSGETKETHSLFSIHFPNLMYKVSDTLTFHDHKNNLGTSRTSNFYN